jgi:hypothetical protein
MILAARIRINDVVIECPGCPGSGTRPWVASAQLAPKTRPASVVPASVLQALRESQYLARVEALPDDGDASLKCEEHPHQSRSPHPRSGRCG